MTWFEDLFGFEEQGQASIDQHLSVDGEWMTSAANGRTFRCGTLQTPSLNALRDAVSVDGIDKPLRARQIVADVTALHQNPAHAGALFQVASQFNLLEMIGPQRTPEHGVTCYAHDFTQGPACALAAAPATVYRNYFVPVGAQRGQRHSQQLDMLRDVGVLLGNSEARLWKMVNGYALCSPNGLQEIHHQLTSSSASQRDALRGALRIGVHHNVEVTGGVGNVVNQAFCSALPVAYSDLAASLWEPFARLVLEAAYEATLLAAIQSSQQGGSNTVFLTLLGGGAFGNAPAWIEAAIERALRGCARSGLEVVLVSHRRPNGGITTLLERLLCDGVIVD